MHSMIVGQTISGKSTCMRWLAREHVLKGDACLVHDAHLEDWGQDRWPGRVFVEHNDDRFLALVESSRRCALFIDEASDLCGNRKPDMRFVALARKGRHRGHAAHFCAQTITGIHHEIRANCPRVFVFNLTSQEARKTADLLGRPEIEDATTLETGEFLYVFPMQPVRRMRIPQT